MTLFLQSRHESRSEGLGSQECVWDLGPSGFRVWGICPRLNSDCYVSCTYFEGVALHVNSVPMRLTRALACLQLSETIKMAQRDCGRDARDTTAS